MNDSLYSLLVTKHKMLTNSFDIDDLPSLRERAHSTLRIDETPIFLGGQLQKQEVVPVLATSEPDVAGKFGWSLIDADFNVTTECLQAHRDLICIATFNRDYAVTPSGRIFFMRFGFFTHESDVLKSRCFGFDGLTIHGDVLDLFEMQYVVEVCRDYRMSCIIVVSRQDSLEVALQTDCPYIAVWAYDSQTFEFANTFASNAISQFPKPCKPILFAPTLNRSQLSAMQSRGYRLIFQP